MFRVVDLPSPGNRNGTIKINLKRGPSIGVANAPQLLIMDEPASHLDLISIECFFDTLGEYQAGLILKSHDRDFLNRLTSVE